MKHRPTLSRVRALMALGLYGSLLVAQPSLAAGPTAARNKPALNGDEDPKKEKKTTKKPFASLNNESVKIYPDALKRNMHVIAKNNDGREIDFFVFDVEGTLVQNYKMKARDHFRISGLARGLYVYRVFRGDEETASGKFEIR